MTYFTCIFGNDADNESFVDTTQDIRVTMHELRALCQPRLLYYEHFTDASKAIDRHLELKNFSKAKLEEIIKMTNPERENLALLI